MSKVEPWQGHKKPPFQSSGKEAWAPVWNLSDGEQTKWVQMPTATNISGLIESAWFKAYAGVSSLGLRSDLGSASWDSIFFKDSTWSGVRLTIQTGLPRHSTVIFSPGAKAEGMHVSGPWSPDTVFMRARAEHGQPGAFDVVVAMYHDQGLIPVKYLGVEQGVNITLGLPFVRTSPDHGTAFDLAGKGVADPSSLLGALAVARRLAGIGSGA